MKALVLPGYSVKNFVWLESVTDVLKADFEVKAYSWSHWTNPEDTRMDMVHTQILADLGGEDCIVVAKSIGTWVAMRILQIKYPQIKKIVLCGVPIHDLSESEISEYSALRLIHFSQVLILQNEFDSHGSWVQIQDLLMKINSRIRVERMPGDTHEYMYVDTIKHFLT